MFCFEGRVTNPFQNLQRKLQFLNLTEGSDQPSPGLYLNALDDYAKKLAVQNSGKKKFFRILHKYSLFKKIKLLKQYCKTNKEKQWMRYNSLHF